MEYRYGGNDMRQARLLPVVGVRDVTRAGGIHVWVVPISDEQQTAHLIETGPVVGFKAGALSVRLCSGNLVNPNQAVVVDAHRYVSRCRYCLKKLRECGGYVVVMERPRLVTTAQVQEEFRARGVQSRGKHGTGT